MTLNVSEMITEVRNQLDEVNTLNVTDAKILAALNRGQRKAVNIIARKYDDLLLNYDTSTTTSAGVSEYTIPVAAYGKRVEKVEVVESSGLEWEIRRIAFHDRTRYTGSSQVTRPYYYSLQKNKIQLYPKPSGGQTIRIWYTDKPETLVASQGRITSYSDSTNDYVIVDTLGDDLTVDTSDGFNAWVNIIDYNTGDIKGTLQIVSINTSTKKITFKSSLGVNDRTSVLGRTIATTLPTDISIDDYICVVSGTCVPEIPGAYSDYITQYTVIEIKRSLGESIQEELPALKDLELELEKMWAGRESSHRIRKSSKHWNSGLGYSIRRLLS